MAQTRSETTIARILRVARTLFLAKSYADVSMARLAEMAGVTKGGLYHHFVSKEELYLALLHGDLEAKRVLFQFAAESKGSTKERLARLTEDFLRLPYEERALIRLVRRDINIFTDPIRTELVDAYQRALPQCVESILIDGIRDGEIQKQDARLASWHFIAMVEVNLTEYADGVLCDIPSKLNHVLNQFFHGCAVTPTQHLQ